MASCEEAVSKIARKLEKVVAGKKDMDSAMGYIEALADLPITVDILTKSRIGLTINDLRKKTTDEKLSKKAKSLIKNWKSLLDSRAPRPSKKAGDCSESNSPVEKTADSGEEAASLPSTTKLKPNIPPKSNGLVMASGDEVRMKSAEMLANAMRILELPDGTQDPDELANRIEARLFEVHRGTGDRYKSALRSRVFNLRDKKNLALRENVLTGAVSPEKFAVMTADEMASSEMRETRDKFTKQAIDEHQMSINEGTPTDLFLCGRCKKRNCTYTQVQTRSADEPMTTFVFCRECGNRWKFC